MKFVYAQAPHFANRVLIEELSAAALRLETKLKTLPLDRLALSDYIRQYAQQHIDNLRHSLQMYTYLFYLALDQHPVDRSKMVVVDYGGGTGILSFLAAELGFAQVLYNDIYDVCCRDAEVLAKALGYNITIVEGAVGELLAYCQTKEIVCHTILSSEVIEHVYDIEDLLKQLPQLGAKEPMRIVLETAANSLNPMINRRLMKAQEEVDRKDRKMYLGKKQKDSLQAYASLRRSLLEAFAGDQLTAQELERLVDLTRGKIKADIEKAAESYLKTGAWPLPIDHPTNTCDPLTGNWCEKLMNPYQLNQHLAAQGFRTQVHRGFYGMNPQASAMNLVKGLFNWSIRALGTQGLRLAPYYVLWAARD